LGRKFRGASSHESGPKSRDRIPTRIRIYHGRPPANNAMVLFLLNPVFPWDGGKSPSNAGRPEMDGVGGLN
jgi:hypothetical protein